MNAARAGVRESDPLEPGQSLCLIRYGSFYDLVANTYAGRNHVVGEVMTFVRRHGAYLVVRDAHGDEGNLLPTSVTATDPRQYFRSVAPPVSGFLIDGLYDDFSGGSLDTVTLEAVEFLGTVALESRFVTEIKVLAGPRPHEVTTHDGSVYRGRAPRLWLATPTLRINLTKAAALTLRRAPIEPSPSR